MLYRPPFVGRSTHRDQGWCIVSPGDDWALLEAGYPNTLMIGPHEATRSLLRTVTPWLQTPVLKFACERALTFPAAAGTLVLDDVDILPYEEQRALLHWLEIAERLPQMISLTTAPLYQHVQAGVFLEDLYYRLNVVHLQVRRG